MLEKVHRETTEFEHFDLFEDLSEQLQVAARLLKEHVHELLVKDEAVLSSYLLQPGQEMPILILEQRVEAALQSVRLVVIHRVRGHDLISFLSHLTISAALDIVHAQVIGEMIFEFELVLSCTTAI